MSLGQSILAAGALIVITILVISANRMIILSQQDEYKSIAANDASEIANAIMNEALSKKFDALSITTYYQSSGEFTTASVLGPEGAEKTSVPSPDTSPFRSFAIYNDFDDYNGYIRQVDTPTMTGFLAICTVTYVQSSNLNTVTTTRGYFKRIVVTVEHSVYLPAINRIPQISFSAVKTY